MATRAIRAHLNVCDYDDCQHEWISREVPDRCAKCKRRRWNKGGLVVTEIERNRKPVSVRRSA
jgi:hypothetical protein